MKPRLIRRGVEQVSRIVAARDPEVARGNWPFAVWVETELFVWPIAYFDTMNAAKAAATRMRLALRGWP